METSFKKLNKPVPALVQTSFLSNEIKKRIPKSRETIPLNTYVTSLPICLIKNFSRNLLVVAGPYLKNCEKSRPKYWHCDRYTFLTLPLSLLRSQSRKYSRRIICCEAGTAT
jgi:hypothetical protein